jgi:hypothetical protein
MHSKNKNLIQDAQGTHVIEKIILCFDENIAIEIFNYVLENFIVLANNVNSLSIVKKVITCAKSAVMRKRILDKIIESNDQIINNAHGNYSIQVAIEVFDGFYAKPIIHQFIGKFYVLSLQKYSSNVIEKSLEKGGDVIVSKFIDEVCQKNRVMGKNLNP